MVDIKTISLMGVNCYLVKVEDGFILIDTGFSFKRRAIVREMENAGCRSGNLKLIIITHADLDHTGNCAYLREKYGAKAAIHHRESLTAASGDMSANRQGGIGIFGRWILSFAKLVIRSARFEPDFFIDDGYDFSDFGFDARALHLPGHSKGSIGVVTADGDLFCGDLLKSNGKPARNALIDNITEMNASIERLKKLEVKAIYPGHGRSFTLEEFCKHNS